MTEEDIEWLRTMGISLVEVGQEIQAPPEAYPIVDPRYLDFDE